MFSSVAAVRGGSVRTGFGAILSAGTFVSALVVGVVAVRAGPFAVDPAPFVRDVLFYLVAALFLFYVYLSGEIFLWQAVGFVGFYMFFVGIVFWMDLGMGGGGGRKRRGGIESVEAHKGVIIGQDCEKNGELLGKVEPVSRFGQVFWQVWLVYNCAVLALYVCIIIRNCLKVLMICLVCVPWLRSM